MPPEGTMGGHEPYQLDGTAPELYERYLVPAVTAPTTRLTRSRRRTRGRASGCWTWPAARSPRVSPLHRRRRDGARPARARRRPSRCGARPPVRLRRRTCVPLGRTTPGDETEDPPLVLCRGPAPFVEFGGRGVPGGHVPFHPGRAPPLHLACQRPHQRRPTSPPSSPSSASPPARRPPPAPSATAWREPVPASRVAAGELGGTRWRRWRRREPLSATGH